MYWNTKHFKETCYTTAEYLEWSTCCSNIREFEKLVELDMEYIDNWSLWLDVKLLLKTVPAVLFARGAK